ncbi:MAG: sigma-70 family RNA polymerase sigma factor, partial [Crocinitomicaceae bacterium]
MNIEQVVELYKNQVYNLALHYVQNTEDAQEITQDVFVSVFQAADSFRGDAQLSTWIYRITVNRSLDFIRAR